MAYAAAITGGRVRLAEIDPDHPSGVTKERSREELDRLGREFEELEDLLFFAGTHSLLIVLQGRDTSGKDGTIRRILEYSNAQGVSVQSFKVPTPEERAHDFLWRVHQRTPARGHCVIFNRSHYEDVLVPRVNGSLAGNELRDRFRHIRAFEELLADSGTVLLKFFLHISREEQEERLLAREADVEKAWKLSVQDWRERERWDLYTEAYDDLLSECAAKRSPWFVVPANQKWFRDLVVLEQLVLALRPLREAWLAGLAGVGERARKELTDFRQAAAGDGHSVRPG